LIDFVKETIQMKMKYSKLKIYLIQVLFWKLSITDSN